MATLEEWAWAAGLFEGEGSVISAFGNGNRSIRYLRLQLKMTDEDVVRRFAEIVGGKVYGPYCYQQGDGLQRKPYWVWRVDRGDAAKTVGQFWPWLGARRRARAYEVLRAVERSVPVTRSRGRRPANT